MWAAIDDRVKSERYKGREPVVTRSRICLSRPHDMRSNAPPGCPSRRFSVELKDIWVGCVSTLVVSQGQKELSYLSLFQAPLRRYPGRSRLSIDILIGLATVRMNDAHCLL